MCTREAQRGLSLVELIIFMVVVGIALAGVLLVMNQTILHSSDPLVRKQVLAIAEALLEEVELMPFTYCDPDDANVTTAKAATVNPADPLQCAATVEGLAPQAGETRYAAVAPFIYFDNVGDYNGFDTATASPSGVRDIANNLIGLPGYRATVTVAQSALTGTAFTVPAGASYLISVTVTGPASESVTLNGYRTRYAPRAP